MPVASSKDHVLILGAFVEAIRYNLTAASFLLAEGVPFVPKDRQREPGDILIPRASIEAIRCNLAAASSRLTDGEPFVPKDPQWGPTDETVVAEHLDGQEEAQEEEPRKGKCGGKGSRKGRSRGEPRDIDSCSRLDSWVTQREQPARRRLRRAAALASPASARSSMSLDNYQVPLSASVLQNSSSSSAAAP